MSTEFSKLLKERKLVLASSSPRRAELLRKAKVDFEILFPQNIVEENISADPVSHVMELSRKKAESVVEKAKNRLILGADTVVVLNGEILGKPRDKEDALRILKMLSSKEHKVYTGITLLDERSGERVSGYQLTRVKFNRLQEEEIKDYIESGEPLDKAGAYGIQGMGNFLVERIEGDLDNVIGLPVRKLKELLIEISSRGEG